MVNNNKNGHEYTEEEIDTLFKSFRSKINFIPDIFPDEETFDYISNGHKKRSVKKYYLGKLKEQFVHAFYRTNIEQFGEYDCFRIDMVWPYMDCSRETTVFLKKDTLEVIDYEINNNKLNSRIFH